MVFIGSYKLRYGMGGGEAGVRIVPTKWSQEQEGMSMIPYACIVLMSLKKPKCNNLIYFSPLTCPKTLFLKPVLMKVFHNGHTVNVFKHLTVSVHRLWCIAHISALRRLSSCKTS